MRVLSPEIVKDKRVLIRLDLDVPFNEDGSVAETTRLDAAIETLAVVGANAKQIILCGHIGRPKGQLNASLSVKPLIPLLQERIGKPVTLIEDFLAQTIPTDEVILLENLRFYEGEEANDPQFAQSLANVADIFIFEAFGVAHRESASTVGITKLLPSYAGLHVAKEVVELSSIIHNPFHPFVVVLNGVKAETKLPVIFHLEDIAEAILLGSKLSQEAESQKLQLPANCVLASSTPDGLDIDQATIDRYVTVISKAQTVVWNGPLGKFEDPQAMAGTKAIAAAIIASEAYSIVGGGDTVAALHELNLLDQFDFISVGGGAMLAFLAGEALPALHALE